MDWISELKNNANEALTSLYTLYRDECVLWVERNQQCTHEDAVDIFQISVLILYDNVITGKLTELTSDIKTYLMGIIRNKTSELVRNKNKSNHKDPNYNLIYEIMEEPEDVLEEQIRIVNLVMNKMGDPCREILRSFFYLGETIQEITQKMGYKNTDVTKNQKYKCLKRLHSMVFGHKDKIPGIEK